MIGNKTIIIIISRSLIIRKEIALNVGYHSAIKFQII